MGEVTTKAQLLKNAGFVYSFSRLVYVNKIARKMFSAEFVNDTPARLLEELVKESSPPGEWDFRFNSGPSEELKEDLVAAVK